MKPSTKFRNPALLALFLLLAFSLSACSPYRVHKNPPKHGKAGGVGFLDFRRSSCGCN
jgi:hypothetical protein